MNEAYIQVQEEEAKLYSCNNIEFIIVSIQVTMLPSDRTMYCVIRIEEFSIWYPFSYQKIKYNHTSIHLSLIFKTIITKVLKDSG